MATKTRSKLVSEISSLCDQAGCYDKIQKLHCVQYVDRKWNPHPPQTFVNWWGSSGISAAEKKTGQAWEDIDAIRAFNCENVREIFAESKQFGIT